MVCSLVLGAGELAYAFMVYQAVDAVVDTALQSLLPRTCCHLQHATLPKG